MVTNLIKLRNFGRFSKGEGAIFVKKARVMGKIWQNRQNMSKICEDVLYRNITNRGFF
jgi:hypothetical protein